MFAFNAPFLPASYHSLVSAPLADNFSSLKYPSHYSLTYHPLPPTTFLPTNYHFLASALLTAHSSHHNSLKILCTVYLPSSSADHLPSKKLPFPGFYSSYLPIHPTAPPTIAVLLFTTYSPPSFQPTITI